LICLWLSELQEALFIILIEGKSPHKVVEKKKAVTTPR